MTVEPTIAVQSVVTRVEENLSYQFREPDLLQVALTHPSFSAENKSHSADNQRLEFLGDAVLQLALTEALYSRFPDQGEGVLTKWRSRLVSKPALATFGTQLGLGDQLLMGRGEEANGGRKRASNLADCVEAVLGAIYLDGGFESARAAVLTMVGGSLDEVTQGSDSGNPKGELQEILQSIAQEAPVYAIVSAVGPDHDKSFVASVTWRGKELGQGKGSNKKTAEAAAASDALSGKLWLQMGDE